MTTLQDLYGTLEQARQAGDLTLTAGQAGAPDLDAFLGTLPQRSLTLRQPALALSGTGQPATLTVTGTMTGTWPLPGLSALTLTMQAATVTYTQDEPAGPVTASLAVTATLGIGAGTVPVSGSLGPASTLSFTGDGGTVSLADAAIALTDGRAQDWVPATIPVFGTLQLSALTVAAGYAQGGSTTVTATMNAPPAQDWPILGGQHALQQIGVTVISSFTTSAGTGPMHSFTGNVHATLDVGQQVGVIIGLGTGNVWEIELDATGGLPALEIIAAMAGVQSQVQEGLDAIGLGDFTLQQVRIGIDRADDSLAYIDIRGSLTVAGASIEASLQLPGFEFGGMLNPLTPVSLTALLRSALGDTGGLPDIEVSMLSLTADPPTGDYTVLINLDDGSLTVGSYALTAVELTLNKQPTGITGAIGAGITVAGTNIFVTGTYGPGWTVSGQLGTLDLGTLIGEVLADVHLPDRLTGLQLSDVSATWDLATGAFSITGQVTVDITLGPRSLATTLNLSVDSQVRSGTRTTTAVLTGSLSIGAMVFRLRYDFTAGQQVLTGGWDAQGQATLTGLASAFGLAVPGTGAALPDLNLTSMSFALDWSRTGEQEFQVTAVTGIGEAFFVVARPQPSQPWAFAFGAAISGAVRLSQLLGPVGLNVTELDFITLSGAAFLVASAPFPSLQVPGIGLPVPVSQGVTAAVAVDLGGTPARPDVATLKTVLSGRPPVLLGEVTLSTSIAAIALTVQLAGTLSITGPGGTSVTLTDVSLVLKPDPVAITLQGSAAFLLGGTPIEATGLLTVAPNALTGALDIAGENGQVLPFPLGLRGVHLTDIGVAVGVTYEPPSLMMGLLGRFIIGPGPATPRGPVPGRSLAATPPPDEFVLILGLEGEVPNPLLLSMYLQQLSLGTAVEALTDQANLPSLLNDVTANDVMIYWCDVPAGLQLPDGSWAYAGYGYNATLDILGVHAYAELKIEPGGITGSACVDPFGIPGVISLAGNGKGTPAAYAGQVTVRPGGAEIGVSTTASPYLSIGWQLTLFNTVSQSMNAQLTSSGFTFAVDGSAHGFSSALTCEFSTSGSLSMAFTLAVTADIDLGALHGIHLGAVHLDGVAASCHLAASVSPSLSIEIDASIDFDGRDLTMPSLRLTETFSSLAGLPAAIVRQIEEAGAAIFAGLIGDAAQYLDVVHKGLVTGADEVGTVLKTGYQQTQAQAATAMKEAGYSVDEAGTTIKDAFSLDPDELHAALDTAGYAKGDIGHFFDSLGGDFSHWASSNLDPAHW